jgi:hypothetical protein
MPSTAHVRNKQPQPLDRIGADGRSKTPIIELQPFRADEWSPAKSLSASGGRDGENAVNRMTSSHHDGHMIGEGVLAYRAVEYQDIERHAAVYRQLTRSLTLHPRPAASSNSPRPVSRIDLHPKWRNYWALFQPDVNGDDKQHDAAASVNSSHAAVQQHTGPATKAERLKSADVKRDVVNTSLRSDEAVTQRASNSRSSSKLIDGNMRHTVSRPRSRQRPILRARSAVSPAASGDAEEVTNPEQQTTAEDMGFYLFPAGSSRTSYSPVPDNNGWRSPTSRHVGVPLGLAVRLSNSRRGERPKESFKESRRSSLQHAPNVQSNTSSVQHREHVSSSLDPRAYNGGLSTRIVENYLSDQMKLCLQSVKRDNVNALWLSSRNPYRVAHSKKKLARLSTIPQATADAQRTVFIKDSHLSSKVPVATASQQGSAATKNAGTPVDAVSVLQLSPAPISQRTPSAVTGRRLRSVSARSTPTYHHAVCQSPASPTVGVDDDDLPSIGDVIDNSLDPCHSQQHVDAFPPQDADKQNTSSTDAGELTSHGQSEQLTRHATVELKQKQKNITLIVTTRIQSSDAESSSSLVVNTQGDSQYTSDNQDQHHDQTVPQDDGNTMTEAIGHTEQMYTSEQELQHQQSLNTPAVNNNASEEAFRITGRVIGNNFEQIDTASLTVDPTDIHNDRPNDDENARVVSSTAADATADSDTEYV